MDPIRVYLSVPEMYVPAITRGLKAHLELPQYVGETFTGAVVRTSESIDPSTRTLLTEVDVPNPKGRLLPGGYAQVQLNVGLSVTRLRVPVNALLFRAEGLRAAVVDDQNRVHLRALTIGRDFGTSLEVVAGLTKDDWIVLNPADSLAEGQIVRVDRPKANGK
jgi:RND family efflux transporter MFP subunit